MTGLLAAGPIEMVFVALRRTDVMPEQDAGRSALSHSCPAETELFRQDRFRIRHTSSAC